MLKLVWHLVDLPSGMPNEKAFGVGVVMLGWGIALLARLTWQDLVLGVGLVGVLVGDDPNDEITGVLGGAEPNAPETWRFSIDVAQSWERAMAEIFLPQTRKVLLRSAMTMSPDRGSVFSSYPSTFPWLSANRRYGVSGGAPSPSAVCAPSVARRLRQSSAATLTPAAAAPTSAFLSVLWPSSACAAR